MASDDGGFGWGFFLGGAIGFIAGAFLASGPGREQVDTLRGRTIELTSRGREAAEKAREAVNNPDHPIGRAVQDGLDAARRRREQLEGGGEGGNVNPATSEGM